MRGAALFAMKQWDGFTEFSKGTDRQRENSEGNTGKLLEIIFKNKIMFHPQYIYKEDF
jgi:hypothetical protein